jgi:hypothetical protein
MKPFNSEVTVRLAESADAPAILAAHRAAVLNTARTSYSDDVLQAWASSLDPERIKQMADNIAAEDQVTLARKRTRFEPASVYPCRFSTEYRPSGLSTNPPGTGLT